MGLRVRVLLPHSLEHLLVRPNVVELAHLCCFVGVAHEPALKLIALQPVPVKQQKCVNRILVVDLDKDRPRKVRLLLLTSAGSLGSLLHDELRVRELWDLLLEELQDVLLLVEVGEVVDPDDEVLVGVHLLLFSDMELGGHDVLLHHSLLL